MTTDDSNLQSLDSSAAHAPAAEWGSAFKERYILAKNKYRTYEFGTYTDVLGADFVAAGCAAIRSKEGIKAGSQYWLEHYVRPYGQILIDLHQCVAKRRMKGELGDWMVEAEVWREVQNSLTYFARHASRPKICEQNINGVLRLLSSRGIIPDAAGIIRVQEKKQEAGKVEPAIYEVSTEKNPYHAVAHGRTYPVEAYIPIGTAFVRDLATGLSSVLAAQSREKAGSTYYMLNNFLQYLVDEKKEGRHAGFFEVLGGSGFRELSSIEWEGVAHEWKEWLETAKPGRKSVVANHYIGAVRRVFASLHMHNKLVPPISLSAYRGARSRQNSTPRKTAAQLCRRPEEIRESAVSNILSRVDADEQMETLQYLQALSEEFGVEKVAAMSVSDLVLAIYELNRSRLTAIRKCAANDFIEWFSHWEEGQRLLSLPGPSPIELVKLCEADGHTEFERQRIVGKTLVHLQPEEALSRQLKYIWASKDGIIGSLGGRFRSIAKTHGGTRRFQAYMHPHAEATNGLWVMLMAETGANCEVVRSMPSDCVFGTESPGKQRIDMGRKGRAHGSPIEDELALEPEAGETLSCLQALLQYKRMSAGYRALAGEGCRTLLLHERSRKVLAPSQSAMTVWFKQFTDRHPELRNLGLLPSHIRPSFLMDVNFRSPGKLRAEQSAADHADSATTAHHYGGSRYPVQFMYDQSIRGFQDQFQAVSVVSISDAPEKLGYTPEQFQVILSDARRTGLGVACREPLAGIQPGTVQGEWCIRTENCWSCSVKLVVGTPENLADIILLNDWLTSSQEHLSTEKPEVWKKLGIPWLAFTDVCLKKAQLSEVASQLAAAHHIADARRTTYEPPLAF